MFIYYYQIIITVCILIIHTYYTRPIIIHIIYTYHITHYIIVKESSLGVE